ncbi:MAG: Gfo/Idh/MocA family oxidoreductase [Succinatimonas sp.]|nr:Gfo/Idh/MocA family oxidoreductase [Succinatimonas sp.]
MDTVKLGILGAGKIASVMAATVKALNASGDKSVKIGAVGSRQYDKALSFIQNNELEDCRPCAGYEELCADPKISLIYVATPHNFHREHALLAIKHGKHVLVEKPFTVSYNEAQELFKAAEEKKVLITEAIWTRYQPMRQMIAAELSSGIIGQPLMIHANLSYPISAKERIAKPELAGGALLDLGVYALNFAVMFFGMPSSLEAFCHKNASGVDMQETITLSWKDGRMASLQSSALVVGNRRGVIEGTKGYMEIDNINNPERLRIYDGQYQLLKTVERPPQLTGFEYELRECCECIRKGALECPSMPHDETLAIEGLMDSARAQMGISFK